MLSDGSILDCRESCEFREFRQDDLASLVEDLLKYKAEIVEKGDFDERIQCHRVIVEEIQNFLARCSPQQVLMLFFLSKFH